MKQQNDKSLSIVIIALFLSISWWPSSAMASELVGLLTSQLGVNEQQAKGGAGSMFGLAKSQLSPANSGKELYSKVDGAAKSPEITHLVMHDGEFPSWTSG